MEKVENTLKSFLRSQKQNHKFPAEAICLTQIQMDIQRCVLTQVAMNLTAKFSIKGILLEVVETRSFYSA
jgi:hypothetical protein